MMSFKPPPSFTVGDRTANVSFRFIIASRSDRIRQPLDDGPRSGHVARLRQGVGTFHSLDHAIKLIFWGRFVLRHDLFLSLSPPPWRIVNYRLTLGSFYGLVRKDETPEESMDDQPQT
jgi:hypothetical protein